MAGNGTSTSVNGMSFFGEIVVIPIGAGGALGAPALVYDGVSSGHGDDMLAF